MALYTETPALADAGPDRLRFLHPILVRRHR
jgi:hypothetical protein